MSIQRALTVTAALLLCLASAIAQEGDGRAAARRQEIDTNAKSTIDELFKAHPAAKDLYDRAAGYAVFTATKAGFIVSGGGGTGVAINKASGQRTYMRMGTGGIGLGVGAQRYDIIILFEDESRLNRFVEGGWDSSATAEAAAGSEGVAVRSSFVDGIAFYQLTEKGLMAHADVTGTRFWVVEELN
jgi:lipid-binding SYLF domain-containing protein